MKKKILYGLFLLFLSSMLTAEDVFKEDFPGDFSLNFFLSYNFARFSHDEIEDTAFYSNRPLDIGIGFGYKKLSLKLSINIPFTHNLNFAKSESIVGQLHYYGEKMHIEFSLKNYLGMHPSRNSSSSREIDLQLLTAGVFSQYIFNHRAHSLRAAYSLNERQKKSSGSFLVGGSVFYASVLSQDAAIETYSERKQFIHFGPNAGYSYSWIFGKDFFLNAFFSLGLHTELELGSNTVYFSPAVFPSLSFGYHQEKWSVALSATSSLLLFRTDGDIHDMLLTCTARLVFVKRF
ncbi:DUF4421 domain-containing protein [Brucepastera parasyntrophica]|uniref:DUF4421 family protein n=1 Tax=Brucepastera parasyntrophica TaxID=2880008 RepID=UPI00210A0FB9|nr:DUF4421 family protein [Brucepastera parasyntrophica]ULQ60337.1 DUF4421 domain-containing protein [Brucepastera parasyntrophica]